MEKKLFKNSLRPNLLYETALIKGYLSIYTRRKITNHEHHLIPIFENIYINWSRRDFWALKWFDLKESYLLNYNKGGDALPL